MVEGILRDIEADGYQVWLSDSKDNNFRHHLFGFYKANRPPRPKHYDFLKEHAITEWGARIAYGMEADDALGIGQDYDPEIPPEVWQTVICSIDKDLHTVPGNHWNFVKKEWKIVSHTEARKKFYSQLFTGDTTDNIRCVDKIGPVKAEKILSELGPQPTETDVLRALVQAYQKQHDDLSTEEILERITLTGRLLKIKQSEEEELWTPNFQFLETKQAV